MKKYSILFFFLVLTVSTYAQSSVNDYKYAQIPSKFEFQETENQYRLNSTIKLFFEQRGFTVFYNNDIVSQEIAANNCNKFFVNVVEKSTLFSTKLKIEIKDCTNKIVLTSDEGSSRLKEFGAAYNEALIMALKSLERIKYSGKEKTTEAVATKNNIIEPKNANLQESQLEITGLSLSKTSNATIYIATSEGKNGVVYKNGNNWLFEYYSKGKLVSEKVEPKF